MNTPGGNTVTTAELTFAMLMSLARKVPQAHASMVAGKWDRRTLARAALNCRAKPSASSAWAASARKSPSAPSPSA